jgi:hypothetical protein
MLLLCMLTIIFSSSRAQQAVFIPSDAYIFSHPGDTVGIFGNVINEGSFGTAPGSVINFSGIQWQNTPLSLLPGNAGMNGGLFRFIGNKRQLLAAGYNLSGESGPSFPNISIENKSGVELQDLNDLHIRGNLHFGNGYLYLNGWNTLVDDSITGFSEKGFIVTGSGIGGGYLYRRPPAGDSLLVFPMGTDADSYSPLGLKAAEPFSGIVGAHVFDHVYEQAVTGNNLDSDYVKKTWQLRNAQGRDQTTVLLQHETDDEGFRFTPFRDSSYISYYRLQEGKWDMDSLKHTVVTPGTLTTGVPRRSAYINDRLFPRGLPAETTDSVSWLSVSTAYTEITCPVADFKLWVAKRYNYKWVQLFWRTLHELNIDKYEVQRRYDTGSVFRTVATFDSKGRGGFSDHLLYYYDSDDNIYDGWTYYRLKMTSASGCVVYTDVQAVPWGIGVQVWPNPSRGETHVRIVGIKHPVIMQLVDTWGQILRNYTINLDGVIDIKGLSDAVYFLVFRDPKNNNKQVTTVKLIVQQ